MSESQDQTETADGQSALTGVLERTEINEAEYTALIKASNHDKRLSCTFGAGVYLLEMESNRWAFEFLANLRSNG